MIEIHNHTINMQQQGFARNTMAMQCSMPRNVMELYRKYFIIDSRPSALVISHVIKQEYLSFNLELHYSTFAKKNWEIKINLLIYFLPTQH